MQPEQDKSWSFGPTSDASAKTPSDHRYRSHSGSHARHTVWFPFQMPSFFAALSSDWLMPMLQKEARKGRRDEQKNPASKISKAGRMARGRNRCRQSGCPGFDSSCRNFFLWILRLASPAGPVMSLGCRQYFLHTLELLAFFLGPIGRA